MNSKREPWFGETEYEAIRNDCDVIIQDDIDSIKKPIIYTDNDLDRLNNEIHIGLKNILNHSMKRSIHKYGETGYIVRSDFGLIHIPVDGDYNRVQLTNGILLQRLEQMGVKIGSLICLHNHPNNTDFSYNDIVNFLHHESIAMIIVVGNTHNVFLLRKMYEINADYDYVQLGRYIEIEFYKYIRSGVDKMDAKDIISDNLINNATKYRLEFKRFKRGK